MEETQAYYINDSDEEKAEAKYPQDFQKMIDRFEERFGAGSKEAEEQVEQAFDEDEVINKLMPKSGKALDFEFGPNHRKEGESFKEYKLRQKIEKYFFKLRKNAGLTHWPGSKGTFVDQRKTQEKTVHNARKIIKKSKFRDYKKQNGKRISDDVAVTI